MEKIELDQGAPTQREEEKSTTTNKSKDGGFNGLFFSKRYLKASDFLE